MPFTTGHHKGANTDPAGSRRGRTSRPVRAMAWLMLGAAKACLVCASASAETFTLPGATLFHRGAPGPSSLSGNALANVIFGDPAIDAGAPDVVETRLLAPEVAGLSGQLESPVFSSDGTRVVYATSAGELVPGGGNAFQQIVLQNLDTGERRLVSRAANGDPGDGNSYRPVISPDGRRVAFETTAPNLFGSATVTQIVEVDLTTGNVQLVSATQPVMNVSVPGNASSLLPSYRPDGRAIAFETAATNLFGNVAFIGNQLVMKTLDDGSLRILTKSTGGGVANGSSRASQSPFAFSPDGEMLTFQSSAADLVAGDNGFSDTFVVRTTGAHAVTRVSKSVGGADPNGNAINPLFLPQGTGVVFESKATNLLANDTSAESSIVGYTLATGAHDLWSQMPASTMAITAATTRPVPVADATSLAFLATDPAFAPSGAFGQQVYAKALSPLNGTGSIALLVTDTAGQPPDDAIDAFILSPSGDRALVLTAAQNLVSPPQADAASEWFLITFGNPAAGDDAIAGGAGNDRLYGGGGNDRIDGGPGADVLAGGAGVDVLDFAGAGTAVAVNLSEGTGSAGEAEGDRISGFENIDGSSFADSLSGDAGDNRIAGGAGDDSLAGAEGDDLLFGEAGNDSLSGGSGADRLDGGPGADMMVGGPGNDTYVVDNPADKPVELAGGGLDIVEASASVVLAAHVENLRLTGTAPLSGSGNSLANQIIGNGAANVLAGLAGADVLVGGPGRDRLSGGKGADRFVFLAVTDSPRGKTRRDVITDFAAGDRIDLSPIDANPAKAGNQAFVWIGSKPFDGRKGLVRFAKRILSADVNGDGRADLEIAVPGTGKVGKAALIR